MHPKLCSTTQLAVLKEIYDSLALWREGAVQDHSDRVQLPLVECHSLPLNCAIIVLCLPMSLSAAADPVIVL